MVDRPIDITLEKTGFNFASGIDYKLLLSLEVRLCVHHLFLALRVYLAGTCVGLIHSFTVSVSFCVCESCGVRMILLPCSCASPLAFITFMPLFHIDP